MNDVNDVNDVKKPGVAAGPFAIFWSAFSKTMRCLASERAAKQGTGANAANGNSQNLL